MSLQEAVALVELLGVIVERVQDDGVGSHVLRGLADATKSIRE
ncbi:MAG: hypothetical protein M5U32_11635 [Myxococcota bacterium]|nr:hypothetical protein [Myxococcota bacterium]